MKPHYILIVAVLLCTHLTAISQISYTANDFGHAPSYNGYFRYGTNGGWYGSSWDDKSLADIAAGNPSLNVAGIGSKTFRPPLPEWFMEYWGYDIRISEFNHYQSLGVRDNTIMLNSPSDAHRDTARYGGCADQSMLFLNMYTPIWDGGANGTPVNDTNYYALYVYKTVTRYKSYTKFWEVVNEPDFDWTGHAWQASGQPGNWWDDNPSPCDLANLKAPIFHYIRMLRISYEVIKSIDPDALIAVGGIGYLSFLDAVLRNTDNPVDGSVTADYPVYGGAWFDVLSFHSYPMYALATWDNSIGGFAYRRHSDAAVNEYINLKNNFDSILVSYGYDNSTYPKKVFICTEYNIPKKQTGDLIGSVQAQVNYVLKALVESQRNDIMQSYIYVLGDYADQATTTDPFATMGLYQRLDDIGPKSNGGAYNQQYNDAGTAFKTCSDLLLNYRYNAARTAAMDLPSNIGGAAFGDSIGNYTYVLWAKTATDLSEAAAATYSFPAAMNVSPLMNQRNWDYVVTNATASIQSVNIALTGTPVFLSDNFQIVPIDENETPGRETEKSFALSVYPNPANTTASVKFTLKTPATVRVNIFNAQGQWVSTAIPSRSFTSGTHVVPLPAAAQLPAGIYYCRFETDIIRIMKKLVIVH